jgi:DNA-binding transcriptional regulator YiaG
MADGDSRDAVMRELEEGGAQAETLLLSEVRAKAKAGDARRIRERRDLSRSEVAQAIGVDQATISRWEAGTRRPKGNAGIRYARFLQLLEHQ